MFIGKGLDKECCGEDRVIGGIFLLGLVFGSFFLVNWLIGKNGYE